MIAGKMQQILTSKTETYKKYTHLLNYHFNSAYKKYYLKMTL